MPNKKTKSKAVKAVKTDPISRRAKQYGTDRNDTNSSAIHDELSAGSTGQEHPASKPAITGNRSPFARLAEEGEQSGPAKQITKSVSFGADNGITSNILRNLDHSNVKPSEVVILMMSYTKVFGFLAHDVTGKLGVIQGFSHLMRLSLDSTSCNSDHSSKDESSEQAEMDFSISQILECVDLIHKSVKFFSDGNRNGEWVGTMGVSLERAAEASPNLNISIGQDDLLDLEILYPNSIISAMFKELFHNAEVHGGSTRVVVTWAGVSGALQIRIDDNGSGFKEINEGHDEILAYAVPKERRKGLEIICDVANDLSGFVTISKSPVLGGARVSITLKPKLYWIDGKFGTTAG